MKLSQFKFRLPEEQIALYPQSIYREFDNEDGTKEYIDHKAIAIAKIVSLG